jgi:hypothetical protein
MDHPSLAEFEAAARREGFDEVAERAGRPTPWSRRTSIRSR